MAKSTYVATSADGCSLKLLPNQGEWFTFYENTIRKDYLLEVAPLRAGDHVIDIGANIGAFAVLAARQVGPTGKVFAYEPDPEVCQRLTDNVKLNGLTNVVVINAAVGGKTGEATLFRHGKSAFSSLFSEVDGRAQEHATSFTVPIVGIQEAIAQAGSDIRLMKVDCEGAEYELFEVLDKSTAQAVQQISMEVHAIPGRSADALVQNLNGLGFNVRRGYPMTATRTANA